MYRKQLIIGFSCLYFAPVAIAVTDKDIALDSKNMIEQSTSFGNELLVSDRQREQQSLSYSPKELVDEAWQKINHQYIDSNFNGLDWQAVREDYLERTYANKEAAYASIREMIGLLEDGEGTVFYDPEEFKSQQTDVSGNVSATSLELKKREEDKIAYIAIDSFSAEASQETRKAIEEAELQQVSGYVLDLRNNQGGLLHSIIDIARMWLEEGVIVSAKDRRELETKYAAKNEALTDKPLVVLVNSKTVSGAEILAAALQENERATVIGEKTAGVGFIRKVSVLSDGSGLVVTIAQLLTSQGNVIQDRGIEPDIKIDTTQPEVIEVRQNPALIATSKDIMWNRAIEILSQSNS